MKLMKANVAEDPVVIYDTMREAANRLVSVYAERVTFGGMDDPAIQEIRAIRAQTLAVDTRDIAAQKKAAADFDARYASASES